jgi:hypothetical protein
VKFGHKAAQAQQDFGGPAVTDARAKAPVWLTVAGGIGASVGLIALILFWRRKRIPGPREARRALAAASARAAAAHQPLSLVRIVDSSGATSARKLAGAARPRLRLTDRLYRLGKSELLVLMPVTHIDAARLVCSDLLLPLSQVAARDRVDIKVIEANGLRAQVLLDRLREPRVDEWDDYQLPLDSLTRTP